MSQVSHVNVEASNTRLAMVWDSTLNWTMDPLEADDAFYPLVVNGVVRAHFLFDENDSLLVNLGNLDYAAIKIDGQEVDLSGPSRHIPTGSVVLIGGDKIEIITPQSNPALTRWLAGYTTDIRELEADVKRDPYTHVGNALAVWKDSAVSPDYLLPLGRAVYNLIVQVTGYEHHP